MKHIKPGVAIAEEGWSGLCICYAECRKLPKVHFRQIRCRKSTIGAGVAECGKYFTIGKFLQIVDILRQNFAESGTFADCG